MSVVYFAVAYKQAETNGGDALPLKLTFGTGQSGSTYSNIPLGRTSSGKEIGIYFSSNIKLEVDACLALVFSVQAAARMLSVAIEDDVYFTVESQVPIVGASLSLAVFVAFVSARRKIGVPASWVFTGMITGGAGSTVEPQLKEIGKFDEKARYCVRAKKVLFAPAANVEMARELARQCGVMTLTDYAALQFKAENVYLVSVSSLKEVVRVLCFLMQHL